MLVLENCGLVGEAHKYTDDITHKEHKMPLWLSTLEKDATRVGDQTRLFGEENANVESREQLVIREAKKKKKSSLSTLLGHLQ